jgi:TolB-like protein/Flp pilus assembly protein TadD
MESFFHRLKRRKLVQWVLAYSAGAWGLVEVADLAGGQFHWPERALQTITILAVVGLFVTVVVAWFHGERGQQRVGGLEFLLIAALLTGGGVALRQLGGPAAAPSMKVARAGLLASVDEGLPAVAVLPFDNVSPDQDNAYFADGVQDDIMTQLSGIPGLVVIARRSVMRYRDSELSPREIGSELNVDALLEGSVRREDGRVRISVELVDATTEVGLWADRFDRDLEDVFAVQAEVAARVAAALQAELQPERRERLSAAPTDDLDAYDFYLRAREAYRRYTPEGNDEAVRLLRRALEIDPDYARAWSGLGDAFGQRQIRYGQGVSWADSAITASRRAVELDPRLPEGYKALALAYSARFSPEESLAAGLKALELEPSKSDAANIVGVMQSVLGRFDEALYWYKRSFRLDPTSPFARSNIAGGYRDLHFNDEAERWYLGALELQEPGSRHAATIRSELALVRGDTLGAYQVLRDLVQSDSSAAGARIYAAVAAANAKVFGDIDMLLDSPLVDPVDPRGIWLRGLARMRTGREEEGRRILRALADRAEREIAGGLRDPRAFFTSAQIYAMLKEKDAALQALDRAYAAGYRYPGLDEGLGLESLKDEPRFLAVRDAIRADIARMRAHVREREGS